MDVLERQLMNVCEIGGVDDGSLRVCCSSHGKTLCAKHYAVTHFVEVGPESNAKPCNAPEPAGKAEK